jgi:hypothetical protein
LDSPRHPGWMGQIETAVHQSHHKPAPLPENPLLPLAHRGPANQPCKLHGKPTNPGTLGTSHYYGPGCRLRHRAVVEIMLLVVPGVGKQGQQCAVREHEKAGPLRGIILPTEVLVGVGGAGRWTGGGKRRKASLAAGDSSWVDLVVVDVVQVADGRGCVASTKIHPRP